MRSAYEHDKRHWKWRDGLALQTSALQARGDEGEEAWKEPQSWDTGSEPRIIIGERGIRNTEPRLLFFLQRQLLVSWQPSLPFSPLSSPLTTTTTTKSPTPFFWTSKKARTAALLSGVHSPNANARTLARTLPFCFRSNTGA